MENTEGRLDVFNELFEQWLEEAYGNETDFGVPSMREAFIAGCRYTKGLQALIGEHQDKVVTEA